MRLPPLIVAGLAVLLSIGSAVAADVALAKEYQNLDRRIQTLKAAVLSLGQDLSLLDKGMLAYSGNPLIVYLSTDIDDAFELQAVELELNGNFVARQEFPPETLDAIQKGGALRFPPKDLPPGDYQLKAVMIGKVGKGREHRANITLSFTKEKKPKTIELRVSNVRERFLPEFVVREWD